MHQEAVKFFDFSALAFPTDPFLLAFAPHALAVKEEKVFAIARIEVFNGARNRFKARRVIRRVLRVRIGVIREQRVIDIAVAIRQKAHFESLDFFTNAIQRTQKCRHDNEGFRLVGNAADIFEARQRTRRQHARQQIIDDLHRDVGSRQKRQE